GETDVHRQEMVDLIESLKEFFRDRLDVYVAGNLLLYYEEGNPKASAVPDVFVVEGIPDHPRRVYKLWEEMQPPIVVWEITSRATRREDLVKKRELYARLRVREYYLFDPLSEYLKPRFQGFILRDGRYEPLQPAGDGSMFSTALGLRQFVEGDRLRLVDTATGEPLLRPSELAAARRAAEERAIMAEERLSPLEAELARLRAELAELRRQSPTGADE
ncbi:MAG: Uma2 family endonuclease, partial [Ardenticatenaceae bacterium]